MAVVAPWTNSFETPAEWTLDDMAQIVENATLARTGSRFLLLKSAYALGGAVDRQSAALKTGITLVNGENAQVTIYAWMLLAIGQKADLIVDFDKGDGSFVEIGRITPGASELAYTRREFDLFATVGTAGRIQLRTSDLSADGNTIWYIDDVAVDPMASTITLRDAIVADFEDITVANGFATEISTVYTEPVLPSRRVKPCIELKPDEGGIGEDLTHLTGEAVQNFSFTASVESSTPHTTVANLLDDIRNAIERTTSNTHGAAGVNVKSATVTAWESVIASEDQANKEGSIDGTITVTYTYSLGSV